MLIESSSDDDLSELEVLGHANEPVEPSTDPIPPTSSSSYQTTITGEIIPLPERSSQAEIQEQPTHHELDKEALNTYIYPANLPPRMYQQNIVAQALFQNVLVALPTGLGKTFIASTVMLNWYRWTKTAKIIFLAPTRPLVSQQIEACLGITGLPRSDSCVLIGGVVPAKLRALAWEEKRVFFATPQTVENDLKKGIVDPMSIACLVVDEAHRATGNHSYTQVVNFIRQYNPSFRLLALTATPSGSVEGVQEVITNLHISRAEIRTEESFDIRQYVHKREVNKIMCEDTDELKEICDFFVSSLQPLLNVVKSANIYHVSDANYISQFGVLQAMRRYNSSPAARAHGGAAFKYRAIMGVLISAGHALQLLRIHGIRPFYEKLKEMAGEEPRPEPSADASANGASNAPKKKAKTAATKKPGKYMQQLLDDDNFQQCMKRCKELIFEPGGKRERRDFIGHEKLRHVVDIMTSFFETNADSRAIIFAEFRESAAEILRVLEAWCPARVRAHLFIGQSSSASSGTGSGTARTGMRQKQQQKVVEAFKTGAINTLIATSIGEEGLDIGQVDLIICYDQSKSPIRGLQRMGRTGRKREGNIYMLMTKKEENKLEHALTGYQYIQNKINDDNNFVYASRIRIVPPGITPKYVEQVIDIPEENREVLQHQDVITQLEQQTKQLQSRGRKRATTASRRKLDGTQKQFKIPEGVNTGFRSAAEVAREQATSSSPATMLNSSPRRPVSFLSSDEDDEFADTELDELLGSKRKAPDSARKTQPNA